MKISVIIPFSHYPHYLKECLESLKTSAFQDFETLLVVDKEHDCIDDVIKEYSFVRVIESQVHGCAACRNVGMQYAMGEYIYFLDADDYVLENTLGLLAVHAHGEDIVYGAISNTWNNKANYLEKIANQEIDPDDLEEKQRLHEEKVDAYRLKNPDESEHRLQSVYYLLRVKKGIRSITALGILFKTTFIRQNGFTFDENYRYYSDMTFLCPVLDRLTSQVRVEDAIYVKRKHNDPINYPALSQEESDDRFEERCKAVETTRSLIDENGIVRYYLDFKLIHFFTRSMSKRLRRSQDERWRNEYFTMIIPYIEKCRPDVLDELSRNNAKMVRALLNHDLKGVQKQVRWVLGKKKFKKMLKNKNTAYKLAYFHRYLKQPVKENVILFETFMAKNYSDSPKYIYEYIAQNHPEYECVWAINDGAKIPYGAKTVKRFSFQYAYYLAVSKYLVFNVRPPLWYRKREEQVFLETWHGTPLKRLVFDQEEVTSASPKYKQQFYRQRKDWDFLVSANPFSTKTFRSCFLYEGEMLEYGYPRNDILYWPNKDEIAQQLKEKLGIPKDKKTILYAPTWRDDQHYGSGQYKFELALDLKLMKERLQDDYVVLLRTHHYISDHIDVSGLGDFVINLSSYDDISEIYLISDICITDYSSVFFDYANLKRPILFYTYDFDKYKNQLRGFYIDMNTEVPGPLLYTSEQVVQAIEDIDEITEEYKERYDQFYDRFCCYDDGHASEHVAEAMLAKK
ncbi:CDP-glycerol:glycerophosphate glycerophosphotransferase [Firmicutes bacterium AM41-11]|nr:CDP-glycerol:glycerophosphate glycerophosphotransferase [Firmicutes bacterium AM41-11]